WPRAGNRHTSPVRIRGPLPRRGPNIGPRSRTRPRLRPFLRPVPMSRIPPETRSPASYWSRSPRRAPRAPRASRTPFAAASPPSPSTMPTSPGPPRAPCWRSCSPWSQRRSWPSAPGPRGLSTRRATPSSGPASGTPRRGNGSPGRKARRVSCSPISRPRWGTPRRSAASGGPSSPSVTSPQTGAL
ncbi:MAG: hypothetical protein AVDCRST_MAG25-700, partial [uncultured Rubrobacteraceae bacterium]